MTAPDGRVSAWEVRQAALAAIQADIAAELAAIEAKYGLTIPVPASYAVIPDFRAVTDKHSPLVVVTVDGLDGQPETRLGDTYTAVWRVTVYIVIRTDGLDVNASYEHTGELVAAYCTALTMVLLKNRQLGGLARTLTFADEAYAALDIDVEARRLVGAGQVQVLVTVDNARDPRAA
jgi:hypothetical protein